jgi:hypothetical protein
MRSPKKKKKNVLKKKKNIYRVNPEISSSTSRQPRKLNFGIQAHFNPTRRNMNKIIGVTQLSLSLAKADPSIAWARFSLRSSSIFKNLGCLLFYF